MYIIVLFFTHIPFVVNHTINATPPERLQHPLLFTMNHIDRMFFVWRLNSARPPHPGHSTILLRSEIPSSMCAKLRTAAASNNRDHARNLSLRTLVIMFNRSHVNIGRATTSQSIIASSRYIYNGVFIHAHPVRGESYNQRNTAVRFWPFWLCLQNHRFFWHVLAGFYE